jgi:hypothetical protein
MDPNDIAIEILKGIREEVRDTRTELKEEIRGTNARLDGMERRPRPRRRPAAARRPARRARLRTR